MTEVKINGGTLVRAAKACDCKTPDVKENDIHEDDEWTCACGQGWRARSRSGDELSWRRISKRTPKAKKASDTATTPAATNENPASRGTSKG